MISKLAQSGSHHEKSLDNHIDIEGHLLENFLLD